MPVAEHKRRKSGLTTLDLHRLELACQPIWRAFGATYLVGTAQTGGKYRDVDVRTILRDEDFDRRFGFGTEGKTDGEAFWALVCSAVGQMLQEQTGLPIDYQVQRMTEANERYSGQPRNPVGHANRVYAGGGDATQFNLRAVCGSFTLHPDDLHCVTCGWNEAAHFGSRDGES
jgi:hypothetical protein